MKCNNCGNEFEGNFCPECGAPASNKSGWALLGFRSNTTWKKILSVLYLVFCFFMTLGGFSGSREGQITIYDHIINKVYWILPPTILLSPYIFLSNTKIRNTLPLFKEKTVGKSIGGMAIVLATLFSLCGAVDSLHSAEYKADMENHAYVVASSTNTDCTLVSEIEYCCEYCGRTKTEKREASPHDMQEESRIEASCTNKGSVVSKCSQCGFEETSELETIGHTIQEESRTEPTCTTQGSVTGKCQTCQEYVTEPITALGHDMKEISRTEPSNDDDGTITYKCTRCAQETTETIVNPNPKGSKENPYVLDAAEWHKKNSDGTAKKYIDKYVKVTGTLLNISDLNTLKGYYLVGGPGCGLICWVENGTTSIQYGQTVTFIGKVTIEDPRHIEVAECEVVSAQWPTEKMKSPVTMSDRKWSRDYVGGVEWSFRFTNNTEKVVKYITVKWNCYNAVGDLVRDEITGKTSHGVTVTGPINPGETTDYLCNSTKFYSYSYSTSSISYLKVEFMDGTVIQINDKAYTDIVVKELENEVEYDSDGLRYVVNNVLGTCYVESIGNYTGSYVVILSSLYGDDVTAIGDNAFASCDFIEKVRMSNTLKRIGSGAFQDCSSLTYIDFSGTIEAWNNIEKGADWDQNTGDYVIYCYDGNIAKDGTITYEE